MLTLYYNLGNALKRAGQLEDAINAYKKAISLKPDYASAYNNMEMLYKIS